MENKLAAEGLKSAADTTKQIITLSTGVIALTVTFLEKIIQPQAGIEGRAVPWTLLVAWVLFGLTILSAILTLGAITGTLDALDRKQNGLGMTKEQDAAIAALSNGSNVQIPARMTGILFILAMALTIATGFLLLH